VYRFLWYHWLIKLCRERTPQPSTSKFGWISDYFRIKDDYVLHHSSLDNYLFLRFFKILFTISLVGAIITWPILFPVYATGKCFLSST